MKVSACKVCMCVCVCERENEREHVPFFTNFEALQAKMRSCQHTAGTVNFFSSYLISLHFYQSI